MLSKRLTMEINETEGLAASQYGFIQGKSTPGALQHVIQWAEDCRSGTRRTREITLLVLLDVQNAFGSVILEELEKQNINSYLRRIIAEFPADRKLQIQSEDGMVEYRTGRGVPEGSSLSPLLWNIDFDEILRLDLPAQAELLAYADDLVIMVRGRTEDDVEVVASQVIRTIGRWMADRGLRLAPAKTQMIAVVGRRRLHPIKVQVEGLEIVTQPRVKYLGIYLH